MAEGWFTQPLPDSGGIGSVSYRLAVDRWVRSWTRLRDVNVPPKHSVRTYSPERLQNEMPSKGTPCLVMATRGHRRSSVSYRMG